MLPKDHSELDALFAATLVDMSEEFYTRLIEGYQHDGFYKRIIAQIDENDALGEDARTLPFVKGERLPAHETDPYFGPRASKDPVEAEVPAEADESDQTQAGNPKSACKAWAAFSC
jgi:hypothetical protein